MFELHPVTQEGDLDVRDTTFNPITGYTYKDAEASFVAYENVRSTIIPAEKMEPARGLEPRTC